MKIWSKADTEKLIKLRTVEFKDKFIESSKNSIVLSQLWKQIAEKFGENEDSKLIAAKYYSLMKQYRNHLEQFKKTGKEQPWEYFEFMKNVVGTEDEVPTKPSQTTKAKKDSTPSPKKPKTNDADVSLNSSTASKNAMKSKKTVPPAKKEASIQVKAEPAESKQSSQSIERPEKKKSAPTPTVIIPSNEVQSKNLNEAVDGILVALKESNKLKKNANLLFLEALNNNHRNTVEKKLVDLESALKVINDDSNEIKQTLKKVHEFLAEIMKHIN